MKPTLAIIGGTGQQGSGLAVRFAKAGYRVVIGSRDIVKAKTIAGAINTRLGITHVEAADCRTAAAEADIVMLTVPFASQQSAAQEIATSLNGKILVDATVPLVPEDIGKVQLPRGGSAVAALQAALPDVKVVSAFQNVSHIQLQDLERPIIGDIIVCGNDEMACDAVVALIDAIGLRAFHGGPIENSIAAEALTAVLISVSRKYRTPATGLRVVLLNGENGDS